MEINLYDCPYCNAKGMLLMNDGHCPNCKHKIKDIPLTNTEDSLKTKLPQVSDSPEQISGLGQEKSALETFPKSEGVRFSYKVKKKNGGIETFLQMVGGGLFGGVATAIGLAFILLVYTILSPIFINPDPALRGLNLFEALYQILVNKVFVNSDKNVRALQMCAWTSLGGFAYVVVIGLCSEKKYSLESKILLGMCSIVPVWFIGSILLAKSGMKPDCGIFFFLVVLGPPLGAIGLVPLAFGIHYLWKRINNK